jgi:lipopolysaccharide/colanic/teichoic acid biosynthesis glycosyltransferase
MIDPPAWTLSADGTYLVGAKSNAFYHLAKRLIDLMLGFGLFILLVPLMCLIAVCIKLDTSGPVLFVQPRVGARRRSQPGLTRWNIVIFPCYKFRSMTHNADTALHRDHISAFVQGELSGADADHARFKLGDDPRITRVGKYLRQSSLDELPQLLNVIKGDMSLVGPRPVPTYEVEQYQNWHHGRLAALPGITGYWQIKGRGSSTFEEMIAMDLDYIAQRSLGMDVRLLLSTIPAVLTRRGAR